MDTQEVLGTLMDGMLDKDTLSNSAALQQLFNLLGALQRDYAGTYEPSEPRIGVLFFDVLQALKKRDDALYGKTDIVSREMAVNTVGALLSQLKGS